MTKSLSLYFTLLIGVSFSQGVINDNAQIVLTTGSFVVVNGATGHYTNQNGGLVNSASPGGEIHLQGNWINNATNLAFANDGSRIRMNGANQSIGGSSTSNFYHLNLEGTGTKTLNVNTNAGGITDLTGVLSVGDRILNLNSFTFTMTNPIAGGITSNPTGYILSETNLAVNPSIVRWNMQTNTGPHTIPFGVAGVKIPFVFDKTTGGASDIHVSTRATTPNNQPWAGVSNVAAVAHMAVPSLGLTDGSIEAVIDRWWDITPTAAVTANVTFTYRTVENTTNYGPTEFGAQHWTGSVWEAPVGSGNATGATGFVTAPGLTGFSPYVLAPIMFPLPITLSNYSGECVGDTKEISWSVENDLNAAFYTIERSRDGFAWSVVEEVPVQAPTANYTVFDFASSVGETYYRLVRTGTNGENKQLGLIAVECSSVENSIAVYPNPSNGQFKVELNSSSSLGQQTIQLSDALGRVIQQLDVDIVNGVTSVQFEELVSTGVYYIQVLTQENKFEVKKIIVNK